MRVLFAPFDGFWEIPAFDIRTRHVLRKKMRIGDLLKKCYYIRMDSRQEQVREQFAERLKEYFEKRDDIVMAFLFGSQAEGRGHAGSDWDIAVYFAPAGKKIEWEEQTREYPEEKQVWNDCARILETDRLDLIVLNRAPASIADVALRGKPLVIKDRRIWLEFFLRITSAAIDFRNTVREYADVYWRSSSLTESDAHTLDRRLIFVDGERSFLKEFSGMDWQTYQTDDRRRRMVERTIENVVNMVIDVSKIVLASEKKPAPQTYREIVEGAALILSLPQECLQLLASWVGLRNVLAHEYLDYRWREISDFLAHSHACLETFLTSARSFLATRRG